MSLPKTGIHELLVRTALEPELRRRLLDSPDEVLPQFNLSEEEKDLLRHPDHRLLPLLGEVLKGQAETTAATAPSQAAPAIIHARTLPDFSLAVTVVPCTRIENGVATGYSYAVWVSPLAEGVDPASLAPPDGTTLPGPPLAPLHVVMQIHSMEIPDAHGRAQVGMSASLRQSSNIVGPVPATRTPGAPSEALDRAVAAVRAANREERYGRLLDLLHALHAEGGV